MRGIDRQLIALLACLSCVAASAAATHGDEASVFGYSVKAMALKAAAHP